jgi:hypothetical protein
VSEEPKKKRRGRPRKTEQAAKEEPKKKRGRPKKDTTKKETAKATPRKPHNAKKEPRLQHGVHPRFAAPHTTCPECETPGKLINTESWHDGGQIERFYKCTGKCIPGIWVECTPMKERVK